MRPDTASICDLQRRHHQQKNSEDRDKLNRDEKARSDRNIGIVRAFISAQNEYNATYDKYYIQKGKKHLYSRAKASFVQTKGQRPAYTFHFSPDEMEKAQIEPKAFYQNTRSTAQQYPMLSITIPAGLNKSQQYTDHVTPKLEEFTASSDILTRELAAKKDRYQATSAAIDEHHLQALLAEELAAPRPAALISVDSAPVNTQTQDNTVGKGNEQKTSFSQKMRNFVDYLINAHKNNTDNAFTFELATSIPFLSMLVFFELLPVLGKMFFPASAFDRMVALQDLDHSLCYTHHYDSKNVDSVRDSFTDTLQKLDYTQFKKNMTELDAIQKKKDSELKDALDAFKDSFIGFMKELTAFPALSAIIFSILTYILGLYIARLCNLFTLIKSSLPDSVLG